jgi:hypothetical protein
MEWIAIKWVREKPHPILVNRSYMMEQGVLIEPRIRMVDKIVIGVL